jgi:hypothetical protein
MQEVIALLIIYFMYSYITELRAFRKSFLPLAFFCRSHHTSISFYRILSVCNIKYILMSIILQTCRTKCFSKLENLKVEDPLSRVAAETIQLLLLQYQNMHVRF